MSPVTIGSTFASARWKTSVALLSLGLVWLLAQPAQAQPGPLSFFKNYFITGDYAVGGVGLRGQGVNGIATGSIEISGVPADADIVAAFLYWQVVTTATAGPDSGSLPVMFKGYPLRSSDGPFGKLLTVEGTAPCWSSGGSTGSSGGSKRTYTYRADVLRYFEVDNQTDGAGNIIGTGKLIVNGEHVVGVPDSGSGGNSTPLALGASLVVVYRVPTMPLSAIVIYDGGYTLDNSTGQMFQTLGGFYQPANPAVAKMTHIVGSGQANKSETLLFGAGPAATGAIATNPFSSTRGESWDNPTFVGLALGGSPGSVTQVTTGVSPSSDCLTWGAVIFKTEVQDSDNDGLLDIWEQSDEPILDPNGQALPNLKAMGANPYQKDLFVEIGYMKSDAPAFYGGVSKPAHSHLPTHAALKLMGDAFANAPSGRINVHFDVGGAYPTGEADEYIIRGPGLARGGEAIDEMITVCAPGALDPPWVCQFSNYPGTVGWKSGFRFLRDEVLVAPEGQDCDAPGSACELRFDRNRKDMFRYALFAHAIGLPKSEEPCLDTAGAAVPPNGVTGRCDAPLRTNPDFHVPRTNTGIGDFPGGDVMVTLGAFTDHDGLPLGTPFMQASTLMHEVGHNLERRHGGEALEPNCKPAYLSVMNYLYQLRGLLDDTGKPNLDFSWEAVSPALDETSIFDGFISPSSRPYRMGWYAPLFGSYLEGRANPVLRHCDGSDLMDTDVPMVRIDARTARGAIDWNANGTTETSYLPGLDINFNGFLDGGSTPALKGSDDWSTIRLNQIGARRNTGGVYVVDSAGHLLVGPLSLDSGRGDLGRGDLGRGDLGRGDLGRGDLGRGDLGRGDLGRGDLGRGDLGRGDLGRGDLGRGDLGGGDLFLGNPQEGELDFETAGDLAKTPPTEFRACVIGVGDCTASAGSLHDVRTDFKAPTVGGVSDYIVYRVASASLVPGLTWVEVGRTPAVLGQTEYTVVDSALPELLNGFPYTYFAVAVYVDTVDGGTRTIQSDVSNLVTIDPAVNDTPTISDIADQTIFADSSAGPLSFTVGDERLFRVTVTGTSSNTALVPASNIVFAGTGANRTVTVTPLPSQTGTATITVTVTDGAGYARSDSFVLTVKPLSYTFFNVQNAPPPANKSSFKAGSAVPMKWQFKNGSTVANSSLATFTVAVKGPLPAGPVRIITNTYPGSSSFRYDATTNTWSFNLQTKDSNGQSYPVGTYEVTITPAPANYLPSPAFQIKLVK